MKYRVLVDGFQDVRSFYFKDIEVEADSEEEAVEKAREQALTDGEDWEPSEDQDPEGQEGPFYVSDADATELDGDNEDEEEAV